MNHSLQCSMSPHALTMLLSGCSNATPSLLPTLAPPLPHFPHAHTRPCCLACLQVRHAIEDCHDAGIRVVVITGDNKLTAEAICRSIGVFDEVQAVNGNSMTGLEFAGLPESGGCLQLGAPIWLVGQLDGRQFGGQVERGSFGTVDAFVLFRSHMSEFRVLLFFVSVMLCA